MAYYQIGLDETVSWIGNAICLSGQLMQILETNDTKSAKDLSIGFLNMNFVILTRQTNFLARPAGSSSGPSPHNCPIGLFFSNARMP